MGQPFDGLVLDRRSSVQHGGGILRPRRRHRLLRKTQVELRSGISAKTQTSKEELRRELFVEQAHQDLR